MPTLAIPVGRQCIKNKADIWFFFLSCCYFKTNNPVTIISSHWRQEDKQKNKSWEKKIKDEFWIFIIVIHQIHPITSQFLNQSWQTHTPLSVKSIGQLYNENANLLVCVFTCIEDVMWIDLNFPSFHYLMV